MRSAGRVRPSDHPRETHPNISSARKCWGPRECPCRVLRGTGPRGPRLRAEKTCGPQRRATRPGKPPHKHFCFTIRRPAPAGVSQACGLAMPNTGSGAGHDSAHPTHSRVVTPRPVSVHPICSGIQGMCGGPGPVLPLRGYNTRRHAAQFSRTVRAKPERLEI